MAVKKKKKVSRPKKSAKAKAPAKKKRVVKAPAVRLEKIGEITHYFPRVKAAAMLVLKDGLALGDSIYVKGHTTDFRQVLKSMQLDRVPIEKAKKTEEIGILVKSRVRIGDAVYRG